ncbi:metallophosphoesterase family protein [Pannus brasiliensis CCIBt3594]|uniref:Metallophosphoesterase family protein n=1 Tax=Pannus brasiliensis CCIBt3594 TaxID=1427578 RepID=A0AAW9QN72_9CHRO
MFFRKNTDRDARPRRLIIGDVHGHFDTLMRLLDKIAPRESDRLYFLGDLIDRGEKSKEVVDFVIENDHSCILGNHEHMLLKAIGEEEVSEHWLQNWLHSGGAETLIGYDNQIPEEHLAWFKALPNYLDLGDIWLVHAGVDPRVPIQQQTSDQFCWIRDRFHAITKPYFPDKLMITGHTVTFTFPGVKPGKIARGIGWIGIETGAYHPKSGWLTALDLGNQKVYQANVLDKKCRVLPLDRAIVDIDPGQIAARMKKPSRSDREQE